MNTNNVSKRLSIWAVVVAGMLMIPFITGMPWTSFDYTFAGIIIFGLATIYELATRNMKKVNQKVIVAAIVLGVLVLIWAWAVN